MKAKLDRRSFLRVAGTSFGIGALYSVFPGLTRIAGAEGITRTLAELNGEAPAPFSFVQLSDPHVGFNGPPDPLGTKAFESAVATINGLKKRPELVIVTGDLTHDADSADEHAKRFKLFKEISGKIGGAQVKVVPGENDAALDGGDMFREFMGPTHYSFDYRGVHFVALDNVSAGRPAGRRRATRLDEVRSRALSENRADHRVHPSSAVRPQARMGMVHQRRRRRHERARTL